MSRFAAKCPMNKRRLYTQGDGVCFCASHPIEPFIPRWDYEATRRTNTATICNPWDDRASNIEHSPDTERSDPAWIFQINVVILSLNTQYPDVCYIRTAVFSILYVLGVLEWMGMRNRTVMGEFIRGKPYPVLPRICMGSIFLFLGANVKIG